MCQVPKQTWHIILLNLVQHLTRIRVRFMVQTTNLTIVVLSVRNQSLRD